jgi:Peptidase A4 family
MKGITRRLVAVGIGVTATIGMISIPAGAATASPTQQFGPGFSGGWTGGWTGGPGGSGGPGWGHPTPPSPATSTSFAGYSATPSGGVTGVSASFIVPYASCPANSEVNIAAAIYDTAGALQAGADVVVECTGGVAAYGISALTYNTYGPTVAVHPGDWIYVSDSETASTTTATATDLSARTSSSATDATGSSGNPSGSLSVGLFDDTGNLPTFGVIPMFGVQANGQPLSQLRPTQFDQSDGQQLMIATTPLVWSSFGLIFLHNT